MQSLTNETLLLDDVFHLNGRFLERILSISDDVNVRELTITYEENLRNRHVNLGFNVFALVSDVYYRENFHSDVIAAIFDPSGEHKQKDLYLRLFLEFLRDSHGVALRVDVYKNAIIEREPGRIDILIYDKKSEKAIIVENKMNGAGDMDRQVVRYLETVEGWGYQCDTIIYLTLNFKKEPSMHGWDNEERARVKSLLCTITAFEDSPKDLYHGWLAACHDATQDNEVAHVIRQYRQLILKLGHNAMNKTLMDEYYKLMRDESRYNAALSLSSMLSDLPAFRCQKLVDEIQQKIHPFLNCFLYRPTLAIFEGLQIEGGSRLKVDVDTTLSDHTKICFWDNLDPNGGTLPKRILNEIGLIESFTLKNGQWRTRNFLFPAEEESLRDFLDDFFRRLHDYVNVTLQVDI